MNKIKAEYDHSCRQVEEEEKYLRGTKMSLADTTRARDVVQRISQALQESAHQQVSEIVTRCLKAVFGEDTYEFGINFEEKRGRTEAFPHLKKGDLTLSDPLNEGGGGVCDVVSFALRLSALILSSPPRRKLLVLDEPFKGVRGKKYQDRVGELILSLAQETGTQFVICSDFPWLRVGEVIDLNEDVDEESH